MDEGHFIFEALGKTMFRAKEWAPGHRSDVLRYDSTRYEKEFSKLGIEESMPEPVKAMVVKLVKSFWDIFAKEGLKRTMLGFEFAIDTGSHTPVKCRKPRYGPNESKVIMETIRALLSNNFIEECSEGGWLSPIVLAPKPHQEHVTDIEDLVWRMCVSFRGLNKVTNPFEFPIGRCDAAIEDVGDGNRFVYFVSLDAAQGYHQIAVRKSDKIKLAFFAPNNKKYTYRVMPFGPTNAPTYYTAATRIIQDEATRLFRLICNNQGVDLKPSMSMQPDHIISKLPRTDDYIKSCSELLLPNLKQDPEYTYVTHSPLFDENVHVVYTDGGDSTIRQEMQHTKEMHITGSAVIIDDLLLRSTSISLLLLLVECFFRVYLKYRTTLKLPKCDFFKKKFEFVGHDILPHGNTTASSKYGLIQDWKLPETAESLHSFISLCNFYNKFLPLFELKIVPLRRLCAQYNRKRLPNEVWTPELKTLFESLKDDLTSAPVLARFDSSKPVFLKTDWSAIGMSFILMQPENGTASRKATDTLLSTGQCLFDLKMAGPRLQPFASGYRACTETEKHYHSFVGESAALRWAIAKNKDYLWGQKFYCLCDMKTLYKMLEYDGPIHCLRRWSQELQAYTFETIHRPALMMKDVDALNRGPFAPVLKYYLTAVVAIREQQLNLNKQAYDPETFEHIMSIGKYNLKSVRSDWDISQQDKLHASVMLANISTESRRDAPGNISQLIQSSIDNHISEKQSTVKQSNIQQTATHYQQQNAVKQYRKQKSEIQNSLQNNSVIYSSNALNAATLQSYDLSLHLTGPSTNYSNYNTEVQKPKSGTLVAHCKPTRPHRESSIAIPTIQYSSIHSIRQCQNGSQTFHLGTEDNLSARDDLEVAFAHLAEQKTEANPQRCNKLTLDIVRPTCGSTACQSPLIRPNTLAALDICSRNMTVTWVALNTPIPAISYHLHLRLNDRFDCNIFQPDTTIISIARQFLPEATFIQQNDNVFWDVVQNASEPLSSDTVTAQAVYSSVTEAPIAYQPYSIDGIEDHIHDVGWVDNLRDNIFPLQLFLRLRRFQKLFTLRRLRVFILTLRYIKDLESEQERFMTEEVQKLMDEWVVSVEFIPATRAGDPILARRAIIIGIHSHFAHSFQIPGIDMPMHPIPNVSMDTFIRTDINIGAFALPLQGYKVRKPQSESNMEYNEPRIMELIETTDNNTEPIRTLHTGQPATESIFAQTTSSGCTIHQQSFAILYHNQSEGGQTQRRMIMPSEYVLAYLAECPHKLAGAIQSAIMLGGEDIFLSIVTSAIPFRFSSSIADHLVQHYIDTVTWAQDRSTPHNIIRCHVVQSLPAPDDWKEAYASDPDTNYMIARLKTNKGPWSEIELRKVHKNYWEPLRHNSVTFKNNRLTICKLIGSTNRYLSLIIVPIKLRRIVFAAYHASGVGAHMGKFKTLLAIRMRFFWPVMRKDIISWVNGCPECIQSKSKKRESTGLVHSWPITTPFAILSVDIWKPGTVTNFRGYNGLLNAMCDMTQFVVSVPIERTDSSYIARMFMECVLLKFGICAMVVVDEGSEYRRTFEQMCKALVIRFHPVAKRNHKAVGVERYHRFLNHSQKIATEQRRTSEIFVECGMTTAYAWNASCIDGTDIVRSIPAIGRELKYPLDILESEIPQQVDDNSAAIVSYMQYLSNDVTFSRELLQWIVHDSRERHRERVNEKRAAIAYQPGDIVMGRVAVMSKAKEGKVAKLVYQSRGPFIIVEDTGHSSYIVKRYGNSNSLPTFKFLAEDLYLLPRQVLPCDPVDTTDMRYLNTDYAPMKHPFEGSFDIAGYNTRWYDDEPPSRPPEFILDNPVYEDLDEDTMQPLSTSTMVREPDTSTEQPVPDIAHHDASNDNDDDPNIIEQSEVQLQDKEVNIQYRVAESRDKLIFVKYTSTHTMQARWYLVKVDLAQSDESEKGIYFCTFMQKHPNDGEKPDNRSRWWPEWRQLEWDKSKTYFEFGQRILFGPSKKPDRHRYGLFGTDIDLSTSALTHPFDFLEKSSLRPGQSIVPDNAWMKLRTACTEQNLVPPTLSLSTRRMIATASHFRAILDHTTCQPLPLSSLSVTEHFSHRTIPVPPNHASRRRYRRKN